MVDYDTTNIIYTKVYGCKVACIDTSDGANIDTFRKAFAVEPSNNRSTCLRESVQGLPDFYSEIYQAFVESLQKQPEVE